MGAGEMGWAEDRIDRILILWVLHSLGTRLYAPLLVFHRTLISKATVDGLERNYVLTVNQSSITFDYLPSTLDTSSLPPEAQRYASVFINGLSLHSAFWHHIAVTVYAEDAAFYVNGTVVTVQALEGEMVDEMRAVFLGQTIDCECTCNCFLSWFVYLSLIGPPPSMQLLAITMD